MIRHGISGKIKILQNIYRIFFSECFFGILGILWIFWIFQEYLALTLSLCVCVCVCVCVYVRVDLFRECLNYKMTVLIL